MSSKNALELIQAAKDDGVLSTQSMNALSVVDIGQQIQNALGITIDDVHTSEVTLVTMMPDDSGSIAENGNEDAVIGGHNLVLESLGKSKQKAGILVHTRYLNGKILFPYRTLDNAEKMTRRNYKADLGTPLYDQSVVLLGTVIAKAQEFSDNGVPTRTVTLIMTDGEDLHSQGAEAKDVAAIVKDMLKTETHIIAAMGVKNPNVDFNEVFKKMGIKDEWILTPGNTDAEIRAAFRLFSQSALQASQNAATFSKAAGGGFASP